MNVNGFLAAGAVLAALLVPGILAQSEVQTPPVTGTVDPDGIPYEWIDQAPAVGEVKAYNPEFAFVVASLSEPEGLKLGSKLAVRRDGIVIAIGFIDHFESASTVVVQFESNPGTTPGLVNRPRIGDALIPYPPSKP